MKILTTIRRWFTRKPSAHELLRQVIDEDGVDVDRFCTCAAGEDDDHSAGCLVSNLVDWSLDYPAPPEKQEEYIAPPDRPPPAPEPPLTPEERAEQEARMKQFIDTLNHLRETYTLHVHGGPSSATGEVLSLSESPDAIGGGT